MHYGIHYKCGSFGCVHTAGLTAKPGTFFTVAVFKQT